MKAKKKLAMFIAGAITFLIFCGWIVYFLNTTKKISSDSKGGLGSFLDDIKKNAGESFSKVQSVAGELSQKVRSVGDYYATGKIPNIASSTEATSTNSSSTAKQI